MSRLKDLESLLKIHFKVRGTGTQKQQDSLQNDTVLSSGIEKMKGNY